MVKHTCNSFTVAYFPAIILNIKTYIKLCYCDTFSSSDTIGET